jgi:hypothetical protein
MKVIREGRWNEPWSVEVICSNVACQATLELAEHDVLPSSRNGSRYDCRCCVCGFYTQIPADRIHLRIRMKADAARP